MKTMLSALCILSLVTGSLYANETLNAKDSDPKKLGWMQGFPPERDKTLQAKDGSFFTFPEMRYSVNHMDEFYPTRIVKSDSEYHYPVRKRFDSNIENITFTPWGSDKEMTFKEALDVNYTDGIIVMHKGRIIYENYPSHSALTKDGTHGLMSVSKSFTGTLAAIAVHEGLLDPNKKVIEYVPELKDSGYNDALVREVMDMTTAIKYSENYNDPNAEIWKFSLAGNVMRPESYSGPFNYFEYIKQVKKQDGIEDGEVFGYKTINTELLGIIVQRVYNKDLADLLSEKILKPMGAHRDGYYILDPSGMAFAGGGLSMNLRDVAYFGEMIRNYGRLNGKQVIPREVVEDIIKGGGSDNNKLQFEKSGEYPLLKGWGYRNMWWCTNNEDKAFMARGVHGQAIYIDPKSEMVIARFASNPLSSNKYIDPTSIPLYEAVADYLKK